MPSRGEIMQTAGSSTHQGGKPSRQMILIIVAIGIVFVLSPAVFLALTPQPHSTLYDNPRLVPDFELPRADGGTFRLSDYHGKTLVIYFGYTSCPDVCPTTLYDLRRAMQQLGDEASEVVVVFITIDPENDTPEKITEYLGYFDPSFVGLYGTEEELQRVRDLFSVVVQRADEGETAGGYAITHTTSMFVIDPDGYLKMRMHHQTDIRYIVRDLRYVIRGRI